MGDIVTLPISQDTTVSTLRMDDGPGQLSNFCKGKIEGLKQERGPPELSGGLQSRVTLDVLGMVL